MWNKPNIPGQRAHSVPMRACTNTSDRTTLITRLDPLFPPFRTLSNIAAYCPSKKIPGNGKAGVHYRYHVFCSSLLVLTISSELLFSERSQWMIARRATLRKQQLITHHAEDYTATYDNKYSIWKVESSPIFVGKWLWPWSSRSGRKPSTNAEFNRSDLPSL